MTDYDPEIVKAVEAAEAAAQRSVCNMPKGTPPKALRDALALRVKVNLEQTGGQPVLRVGGSNAEVRRLEAPWSKRRPPESDAPTNGGRQRRTATKATRKNPKRGTS